MVRSKFYFLFILVVFKIYGAEEIFTTEIDHLDYTYTTSPTGPSTHIDENIPKELLQNEGLFNEYINKNPAFINFIISLVKNFKLNTINQDTYNELNKGKKALIEFLSMEKPVLSKRMRLNQVLPIGLAAIFDEQNSFSTPDKIEILNTLINTLKKNKDLVLELIQAEWTDYAKNILANSGISEYVLPSIIKEKERKDKFFETLFNNFISQFLGELKNELSKGKKHFSSLYKKAEKKKKYNLTLIDRYLINWTNSQK